MSIKEKADDAFYRLIDGYSEREIKVFMYLKDKGVPLVTSVAMTILTLWIFMRVYDSIGFEKTIITMLTLGIFLIRSYLKKG